jgi:hypothetical protein
MSAPAELTNSKSVLSQFAADQSKSMCVGGNTATYRISDALAANVSKVYPSLIPFKTPCAYGLNIISTCRATDGTQSCSFVKTVYLFSQNTAGAPIISGVIIDYGIGFNNGVAGAPSMTIITPVYNIVTNALDINVSTIAPGQGRPCAFTITAEVTNASAF